MSGHPGVAGRIARAFIDSKLTPLIIVTSVLLGLAAVWLLPREEEPQIKVPMIDVLVSMPGAGSKEIEERVTRPMEKLLWEIPGVEYIYSTSKPGQSLVIVRFVVGSNAEESVVKLNQKLQSNFDRIPHGVSQPLVKSRSIDDVPILALTFHSARYDHLTLRRLVAQVDDAVKQVPLVAETHDHRRRAPPDPRPARPGASCFARLKSRRTRADAAAGKPAIHLRGTDERESRNRH